MRRDNETGNETPRIPSDIRADIAMDRLTDAGQRLLAEVHLCGSVVVQRGSDLDAGAVPRGCDAWTEAVLLGQGRWLRHSPSTVLFVLGLGLIAFVAPQRLAVTLEGELVLERAVPVWLRAEVERGAELDDGEPLAA